MSSFEVPIEKLRRECKTDLMSCSTTEELDALEGIIGQERAVKALKFGLSIQHKGFNIYVTGIPGIGKKTAIKSYLDEIAKEQTPSPDWCYVYNFKDSYRPLALKFDAGKAKIFQKDIDDLINEVSQLLLNTLDSQDYQNQKEQVIKEFISEEYVQYVNNHWRELINNYEPSILWTDIGYPPGTDLNELFSYFYNKIPEGVVNDRWKQLSINERKLLQSGVGQRILSWLAKRRLLKRRGSFPPPPHYDFLTLEAPTFKKATKDKWESNQSIGMSFAYNQMEKLEDYMSYSDLVRMLVEIVSKNGNLLLSIGPRADGSIPTVQKNCLLGLGSWLEINGEAIFETRPWIKAKSATTSNIEVRFTQKADTLYAILLDTPKDLQVSIKSLRIPLGASVRLLEYAIALHWEQQRSNLVIYLPEELPNRPAHAFKINPVK